MLDVVETKNGVETKRWEVPEGATFGTLQGLVPEHWNRRGDGSGFDVVNHTERCAYAASAARELEDRQLIGTYPGCRLEVVPRGRKVYTSQEWDDYLS